MTNPPLYPIGALVRLRAGHVGPHVDPLARGVGTVIAVSADYTTVRFTTTRTTRSAHTHMAEQERMLTRVEPHSCWVGADQVEAG